MLTNADLPSWLWPVTTRFIMFSSRRGSDGSSPPQLWTKPGAYQRTVCHQPYLASKHPIQIARSANELVGVGQSRREVIGQAENIKSTLLFLNLVLENAFALCVGSYDGAPPDTGPYGGVLNQGVKIEEAASPEGLDQGRTAQK